MQVSLDSFRSLETGLGTPEPLPRAFGDYELLAEVARGGMGVVYRARQRSLDRQVALKMVLSGPFASRVALERFRAEARVAASLQHVGIVAIHEAGEAEGQPYFTMDFVEGRNLADHLRDGPLPPARAARYIDQIARAVAYAHACGVLHRDLKPANILIDESDCPRITDFGLAKQLTASGHLSGSPPLTLTGQALGSPHYMAPELASAQNENIGTAADVYSLGAILYQLLTGRPPFAAGTVGETLHQVLHNEPPRPRVLDPSLPRDLETICLKCLEKEPARRYPSAAMVAEELERFLSGQPLLGRPISAAERGWRWCRRNPSLAALGGLAALLPLAVALALGMLAISNASIRQQRNEKEQALRERAIALAAARKSEQQARNELFLALRNEARARRFSRQMGQRLESLKALAQAARIRADENLRGEATAALALVDVERGPSWPNQPTPPAVAVAFDNLYQRCATLYQDGAISIRKVPANEAIQKLGPGGVAPAWRTGSRLTFSPDGQFLAELDYTNDFRLWRLVDGQSILHHVPGPPLAAAFSPNGRWLVMAAPHSFTRFDLSSGQSVNHWEPSRPAFSLAFNPDNRKLAVGDIDSQSVSIYDSVEGKKLAVVPIPPSTQEIVAWQPDGRCLAMAGSDPRIQIWDVETMAKVATLEGHAQQVTALSFHPDGGLLASGSWDGMVRLWDPVAARQVMEIPFGPEVHFSEDGRWLGAGHEWDRFELWAVSPNENFYTLGQGGGYEGDISSDGRFLAMAMEDGLRVWDLFQRKLVVSRRLEETTAAFFAAGGRELVTCGPTAGLQCWPIEPQPGDGEFTLGPPRAIALPWRPQHAAGDRFRRTIGIISEEAGQAMVLDLSSATCGPTLGHPKGNTVAISPDGRWLASAGWHSTLVRLWETRSGALVHEWAVGGQNQVSFTLDSRELIISSPGEFEFWALDTLKPTLHLQHKVLYPGHAAFSPDQKLMALELTPGNIELKECSTGRTVASLENPFRDRSTWLAFTPGGSQLIVASRYAETLQIWDLAKIRAELKRLGLDWKWPEFPTAITGAITKNLPAGP